MEAIEHICRAARSESVTELDDELASASEALNALHTTKLQELRDHAQAELARRDLGAMIARERRAVRDDPQA